MFMCLSTGTGREERIITCFFCFSHLSISVVSVSSDLADFFVFLEFLYLLTYNFPTCFWPLNKVALWLQSMQSAMMGRAARVAGTRMTSFRIRV